MAAVLNDICAEVEDLGISIFLQEIPDFVVNYDVVRMVKEVNDIFIEANHLLGKEVVGFDGYIFDDVKAVEVVLYKGIDFTLEAIKDSD